MDLYLLNKSMFLNIKIAIHIFKHLNFQVTPPRGFNVYKTLFYNNSTIDFDAILCYEYCMYTLKKTKFNQICKE